MWKQTLIICGVIMQCAITINGSMKQNLAIQDASLSGKVFSDDVIFQDVSARSELDCARKCQMTKGCVTFTVSPLSSGSGVVCGGHTSTVTSQFPYVSRSGTKLYYVKETSVWVGKSCTSNQECAVNNGECYKNLCVCTPGDYYSVKQNLCVPQCATGDLQATFSLKYPDIGIDVHNIKVASSTTLVECLQLCLNNTPPCQNIEYNSKVSPVECHLHNVTAKDDPEAWSPGPDWDFYQRDCI